MRDDRPILFVRQQHSPVNGWVIVAEETIGSERQLAGVFASKSAAQRWIDANPSIAPEAQINN